MSLSTKRCVPCHGETPALSLEEADSMLLELSGWRIVDKGTWLEKSYEFKNFVHALAFVNKIGEIAEQEKHHPDLTLGWGYVTVRLQTHAVAGLHDNDFVVAAKIEKIQ